MKVGGGEAKSIITALLVLHRSSTGYHSEIFFFFCKRFPAQFHAHRHQSQPSPCWYVLLELLALCLWPAAWGMPTAVRLPPGQGGHAILENKASITSKKLVM